MNKEDTAPRELPKEIPFDLPLFAKRQERYQKMESFLLKLYMSDLFEQAIRNGTKPTIDALKEEVLAVLNMPKK